MKLTDHLYLVGSGKWGFGLTDPLDCNVYLIDTGNGCVLIDSGAGQQPQLLDAVIASHGFSLSDIRAIFLTHYHADHACGAARIQKASGCTVYAPAPEAQAIEEGDENATSLAGGKGKSYPKDYSYPKCDEVHGLNNADHINIGNIDFTVSLVPGHSLCDMAIAVQIDGRHCLFTGDSVFAGGEILLQALYDVSILPYAKAIHQLSQQPIDALLPGHGLFCLSGGSWHLNTCDEAFSSGLVPRQFHYFL